MFDELKKYQVKQAFGPYVQGALVAFNGADAKKYKDFIVCAEKPAVQEVKEEVKEVPAEKKVRRVRKGKK